MLVQVRQILRQNPYLLSKLITFLVFTSSILIFSCNGNHTHVESSAFEWFDDFNNGILTQTFGMLNMETVVLIYVALVIMKHKLTLDLNEI